MSHFAVLVITPNKPTDAELQKILLPWHEYECTGYEEYTQDVDRTEEIIQEFNKTQKVVILSNGIILSYYDECFWQKNKFGDRGKFLLPEGAIVKEISADEARKHSIGYSTLEQCAEEYYGITKIVNGRFYKKTNANAKWDWWQIGGRWSGFFQPHYEPSNDPNNKEICFLCNGTGKRKDMECNGCNGSGIMTKWPNEWRNVGNQIRLGDIPLEALRNIEEIKELKIYDELIKIINDRPIPSWNDIRKSHGENIDAARKEWNDNPVVKDVQEAFKDWWNISSLFEKAMLTRNECGKKARQQAIQTFAIVKDGKWYERGEMGWWGIVHDEKDMNDWDEEFDKLIDSLSLDTWLTIVDCHI